MISPRWGTRADKFTETESKMGDLQGLGDGGLGGYIGAVLKFCDMKTFWIWIMVIVA